MVIRRITNGEEGEQSRWILGRRPAELRREESKTEPNTEKKMKKKVWSCSETSEQRGKNAKAETVGERRQSAGSAAGVQNDAGAGD